MQRSSEYFRTLPALSLAVGLILSGCASTDNEFYKHAPSMPLLEVPPDLTRPEIKNEFEIPQIGALLNKEALLADGARVQLKRDGRLRWLAFNREPTAVWLAVRDYWVANSVHLEWENKGLGIMETAWMPHYESEFAKDKFRMRIEPGSEPGTSEFYLSHRGLQEEFAGGEIVSVWAERANDPELEVEVLGQMLVFFGLDQDRKATIVAQAGETEQQTVLSEEGKVPVLRISSDYDRGWKLVLQAIDRLGFLVQEQDRAAGRLELGLDEKGESVDFVPGFAMAGLNRKRYSLQLVDDHGKIKITVLNDDGAADASPDAHQFLQRLNEQLQ